jgi:cyclase
MKTPFAFALTIAVSALTLASAQQGPGPGRGLATAPGPAPELVKIRDNIYVLRNVNSNMADLRDYGGNAIIYLAPSAVVLIDSKSDREHEDLIAKVKTLSDKPVKYVVLTHNHGDHTGGAAKLASMGATLLISSKDRDAMVRNNQPGVPELAYSGQFRIAIGGKELQLREFRGHTRADTVVSFPAERVICAGDLMTTADTIPMIVNYGDGGSWTDWSESIDEILRWDFDTLIPGHGPAISKAQVEQIRRRFGAIIDRVRAMNRDRKPAGEITQTLIREFNWGEGPSAGQIPGMMIELR